jgi:hypothetical protein
MCINLTCIAIATDLALRDCRETLHERPKRRVQQTLADKNYSSDR